MGADSTAMWEIWIDRGGTFTDILGLSPDGELRALKLLSESAAYGDAASEGVRRMTGMADGTPLSASAVRGVKMGTTVATNALLEEDGAKTLFITNKGFEDCLLIQDQTRPDIFALRIDRPRPLPARIAGIAGRLDVEGREIAPLDTAELRGILVSARGQGIQSVAIALINSHVNIMHEARVTELAREAGFDHISLSSEVSPLVRLIPRASTTVIDAYLEPVLQDYAARVGAGLGDIPLYFMQSSGGLARSGHFRARDAVLSGPAGGVVGMAETAKAEGIRRVIGFDMGGTSTDVSRYDGEAFERREQVSITGRLLRAPMLAIHTVAAGGGSILHFDGERARVGPHSAGARPGPAAYGLGGPATITDANLVLGRVHPDWFPHVFGPDGNAPLDMEAARAAIRPLAEAMGAGSIEVAAEGFLTIAAEAMAGAIRQITTAQGIDPRDYGLNAFGGAGGQHACQVAAALGVSRIIIHPKAGLLSALGIGMAALMDTRQAALETPLDADGLNAAQARLSALEDDAHAALRTQGAQEVRAAHLLHIRVAGSDTALPVAMGDMAEIREAHAAAHLRLFGFTAPASALIIESVSVKAEAPSAAALPSTPHTRDTEARSEGETRLFSGGQWQEAPIYSLAKLGREQVVAGPALIMEPGQTITLDAGWTARPGRTGALIIERAGGAAKTAGSTALDPVTLELFNRRFMGIAEEMGVVLERTAHSVNMKERLDFSCAVFDAQGGLVANAPHMPVHLGSMSASVRAALDAHPDLAAGEAVALNAPYNGGTHLPDITIVQPVCDEAGERLFFVASRGHHADVGGIAPGSMPPFSKTIEEEGVVFDSVKILSDTKFEEAAVREVLASGPYPARAPERNIADLKAQLAACARGAQELQRLISEQGLDVVRAYMGHVQDNAERAVRRVIGALESGSAVMEMEGGERICVAITTRPQDGTATIDFTGTSAQLPSNFNAPSAVARAAVLYVLRCLVEDQIPLNEGCLKPVEIIIPEGSLIAPRPPGAVVAGNVETSQLIVDALFAATGRMAAAQGTMNNFTFGNETYQYYETICGGSGAGLLADGTSFDGADAVHTHMTNSRLTDPEIMELRYPVRVLHHRVREGSGGAGTQRGGHGSVRRIEFLEPMEASLLSGRRRVAPPGLKGGGNGAPGKARIIRADGTVEEQPALFSVQLSPGDSIEIETPGGGGFGKV
ncbi:hydantoinase B/oxoprolinase family protein [Glycocaulis abyssi]|uniref:Hydantoinase B/oxoprolinase family protein n=1 Tax=Glycocaulis abyssi TaxID=1433403 RepID=A0ABV9NB22_9PROT